ncbi:unnamed protein product [Arctia plantaginis]|uniref:Uncharacterized protein n=1 Tax=Arctia plantaginis TaxID=874455 RepID=A0A8S1ALI6_ARCPL|nr:unnamed protein product [Arctia plantaginis]
MEATPSISSAVPDITALMTMLQEQARRLEEQLQRDKENRAGPPSGEADAFVKRHSCGLRQRAQGSYQVLQHEGGLTESETQNADVKNAIGNLTVGNGTAITVTAAPSV